MKNKGLAVPTTPEDVGYITLPLTIPDTPEWRGVFCGLLYSISFGYWWDKNSGDWEQARDIGYQVALETCRSMGICDEVRDCIDDDEGIREIIREIIKETIYNGGSGGGGGGLGVGVTSLETCHPDNVFGAVTGLVNYQLQAVRDALELLEVATNRIEFILQWVGNFQVLSPILSTISNWVAWVQDNISENFEAQVTTALIDEYRCDLFCIYLDFDCQGLTTTQVAEYFLGRIGGEGLLENLEDLLNFFITGEFTGTQIVDAMMAGSIAMMVVDLNWIPFVTIPTLYSIETVFALSADNPDSDWSVLCPECSLYFCHQWFTGAGNTPAWTLVAYNGGTASYNAVDDRIDGYVNPTPNTGSFIDMRMDVNGYVSTINVNIPYNATRVSGSDSITVYVNGAVEYTTGVAGAGEVIEEFIINANVTTIRILASVAKVTAGDAGYLRVTNVRVVGEGDNDLGDNNCLED